MKRFLHKLFNRGAIAPAAESKPEILGEHFDSIRTTALEIRDFKSKTIFPTPTHAVRKAVDIDAAWPSSRELFIKVFGVLNGIAHRFDLESGSFIRGSGFASALDSFVDTVDRVTFGLADALGTGKFAPHELQSIDDQILIVQGGINQLRKYVLEDFDFQRTPVRPPSENYGETIIKVTPPALLNLD
jgi:hypothetical protein